MTEVDRATEAALREGLTRAFPDTAFLGEEGGGAVADLTQSISMLGGALYANHCSVVPRITELKGDALGP